VNEYVPTFLDMLIAMLSVKLMGGILVEAAVSEPAWIVLLVAM
jgi:hypothetical protein